MYESMLVHKTHRNVSYTPTPYTKTDTVHTQHLWDGGYGLHHACGVDMHTGNTIPSVSNSSEWDGNTYIARIQHMEDVKNGMAF